MDKKVLMVMPVLKGGGAERVATLLVNEFHKNGIQTEFLLTSCTQDSVIKGELKEEIPLIILQEQIWPKDKQEKLREKWLRLLASLVCRGLEMVKIQVPAYWAYLSFKSQYRNEIKYLRRYLEKNPEMTVVSFLQPSIPIAVLAAKDLSNRVIISERGDPNRLMTKRYGKNFIKKYYGNVDCAVFQTEEAMNAYPENVSVKGKVIFNPIKDSLPEAYLGERKQVISTFCRISRQKKLPLLIKSFAKFSKNHEDYKLKIIGDAITHNDRVVYDEIMTLIDALDLREKVVIKPFTQNVHNEIKEDAMYVNSSDYEGMSNAMLEAMAIGMPVICTDCPIGGAHAVIKDGENGLLVPVNDVEAMCCAMKRIAEDVEMAKKLAINGEKIKRKLSLETIVNQWMELL